MSVTGSGFTDGVEFEETFPDAPSYDPTELIKQTIEHMQLDAAERLEKRVHEMIFAWQEGFEERLAQRQAQRDAELERALTDRFASELAERTLPDNKTEVPVEPGDPLETATSVRDLGRVLRDRIGELTQLSAFAIALHDAGQSDVLYRYRVASDDELGAFLRGGTLDDGPEGAPANGDEWTRAQRTVRVGARNAVIHTAQRPVRTIDARLGVLTLQSEGAAIADGVLSKIDGLTAVAAPHLLALRESGSLKGV